MQCSAVQCSAVQCSAVPCRAVPCRAVPCRAVPCRAVPCRAVPCQCVGSWHYIAETIASWHNVFSFPVTRSLFQRPVTSGETRGMQTLPGRSSARLTDGWTSWAVHSRMSTHVLLCPPRSLLPSYQLDCRRKGDVTCPRLSLFRELVPRQGSFQGNPTTTLWIILTSRSCHYDWRTHKTSQSESLQINRNFPQQVTLDTCLWVVHAGQLRRRMASRPYIRLDAYGSSLYVVWRRSVRIYRVKPSNLSSIQ